MTDNSDFLPVVQQILIDDATINGAVDGEIHRGQPTLQDAKLTNTQKTCIMIPPELNENSSPLIGSVSGGEFAFDTAIEISIISKDRDDGDYYPNYVARLVRNKLNAFSTTTYAGVSRQFTVWNVTITPQYEPEINWYRAILRATVHGYYSTA